MSIQKKEYELSVWYETLEKNGQKTEKKEHIIGAHDMSYAGRATNIKFKKKLNGTHELTFQMPDKFFDNERGQFVKNEFTNNLFNERKIKLRFKNRWYEFYIKSVKDDKQFKSYMKEYTCSDAFIDELSRNGYGIIFDTDLYNNVEEIGTFTEIILEDSIWEYEPAYNWGDFTEFLEEKLFKIPVSLFGNSVKGHKLNYQINETEQIKNVFTKQKRPIEMGDDLARVYNYFWDGRGENNQIIMPLISSEAQEVLNDGYIYIPYSCLDFCYQTTKTGLTATEEVQMYDNKSYALCPNTIDPNSLIQFIAFPTNAQIEIDEAGLIVTKDYHYVMTIKEWNELLRNHSNYFYKFMSVDNDKNKRLISRSEMETISSDVAAATGNWCVYYDGYLDSINNIEVIHGKKISISDRTAINITPEIDQYVTVYNNFCNEYNDYYTNPDGKWIESGDELDNSYRVCSKISTRQIVPQLARNLIQNGIEINSIDGWEMQSLVSSPTQSSGKLTFIKSNTSDVPAAIQYVPSTNSEDRYNTIINFGVVAQEKEIVTDHYYCFGLKGKYLDENINDIIIKIGQGGIISNGEYSLNEELTFSIQPNENKEIESFYFIKFNQNIKNPYIAFLIKNNFNIYQAYFFEAYTKGIDQFDNALHYRYSGRELFKIPTEIYNSDNFSISMTEQTAREYVIFENDIMPGDTYQYNQYFIQQVQGSTTINNENILMLSDTFNAKEFISPKGTEYQKRNQQNLSVHQLPYSSKDFTENELTISTRYIDLNKCQYYQENAKPTECDCSYGGTANKICMYQKYGYCPYLFQTEKHCRKIRTLNGEKSNRFNLTQELSKVFQIYPIYWTEHEESGKIKTDKIEEQYDVTLDEVIPSYNKMRKKLFYITEKGSENKLGFRYELNLSNISRTIKSDKIVTKLYVSDVDSSLSKTGLCSIKTAMNNPSKDSFIIDFSYYTSKGILDKETTNNDLYGLTNNDIGYLKQLGYYNSEYDKLSNTIINLSSESFTELEANVQVNLEGIETAQKQLNKILKQSEKYKPQSDDKSTWSQTYINYMTKYDEQKAILDGLIRELLCNENNFYIDNNGNQTQGNEGENYTNYFDNITLADFKESKWVKNHLYTLGMLGQYNKEYLQIEEWKKQQAAYLKEINKLSLRFYRKYEPYLKEGTWSDGNYLTDDAYYFGACEVAAEGAIPKVEYNITVVDINDLPGYEDYEFDIADTTYVEDIGMFGVNSITGLPNRLKTLISEITYVLDQPTNNSISVQNFTTQFEDLFQQVTASVQSLSFNENIYKRASNFTSNQNVTESSLQGTLDNNNITLLNTSENNIELNKDGQAGSDMNNHSNKYKLNGQGLFFSNNGGQSWNVGVGPSGINADYIKVGSLDAGKIRIVDNDYLYFYWDKEGIVALRDPASSQDNIDFNNFASFNKYGLSIVEDSKVRLRAGYNYNGSISGDKAGNYKEEQTLGQDLGFYLYDNNGHAIFKTNLNRHLNNDPNAKTLSAQLSLQGEIYVTDYLTDTTVTNYKYSSLLYKTKNQQTYIGVQFDFIGLSDVTNNEGVTLKNYCLNYFQNKDGLINETFNNEGNIFSISLNKKDNRQAITYNDRYYSVIVMTLQIDEQFYTITEIDGIWVQITGNWRMETLIFKDDSTNNIVTGLSINPQNVVINGYDVSNQSNPFNIAKTQYSLNQCYIYTTTNEIFYYQNKENVSNNIPPQEGSTIGIYINNQSINNSDINYGDDYQKRVFSCLKSGAAGSQKINNLFTILDNGNLYIGGQMRDPQGHESPAYAMDYLAFDNSNEQNTIKIENGRLIIGGSDIVSFFQQQINDISNTIANQGLIRHNHYVDGTRILSQQSINSPEGNNTIWVRITKPTGNATDWACYQIQNNVATTMTGGTE